MVHGQQAHRRDADPLQVRERGRMHEPRIGATQRRRDLGMALREPFDMQFIEQQVFARMTWTAVSAPVHGLVHDACERRTARAEHDLACPGVEQETLAVETMPPLRLPRTVRAQTIEQSRSGARQSASPEVISVALQRQALQFSLAGVVEHADLDALRMGGEDLERDAGTVPARA